MLHGCCDRDEIAEDSLAGELRAGARADDGHLADRLGAEADGVQGARHARQRILAGKRRGRDAGRQAPLGELERHELLEVRASRSRRLDLRLIDAGDPLARDVLGSSWTPKTSPARTIAFAIAS